MTYRVNIRSDAVPGEPGAESTRCVEGNPRSPAGGAGESAAEELGDPERQIERLATVEARIAHRLVAQAQVVVDQLLGAAEALGDVVAGQLHVHPAGPGPLGLVGVEEALDL